MFRLQARAEARRRASIGQSLSVFCLYCVAVLAGFFWSGVGVGEDLVTSLGRARLAGSGTDGAAGTKVPSGTEGIWDSSKYISLSEIKAGAEAYCLTEYGAAGIERFNLEVIDVVRGIEPGKDAILVKGTDERFVHTGPVAGCSGSPVYIDGRLAGALAFMWSYSKDPFYGVTPIEDMLRAGRGGANTGAATDGGGRAGFGFDFSKPLDFAEVDARMRATALSRRDSRHGAATLPCPLVVSGLPGRVCEELAAFVEPLGFVVVPGMGGGLIDERLGEKGGAGAAIARPKLLAGSCLAVPFVSGDINLGVYGTVTEIRGDQVYGFGHSLLGYGPVDLPMATGKVHTVLTSMARSSKLCSSGEVVGALKVDEGSAVLGCIGAKPQTFPLTLRVTRYNDTKQRVYNCQVASNRLLTPSVLRAAVSGAALVQGEFPPDHLIEYRVTIGVAGYQPIKFENVSTSLGLAEMLTESGGTVALLMNNPFKEVQIESMDCDIRIEPKSIAAHIWSVDVADTEVKPGEQIEVGVVIESVRSEKKKYACKLQIPKELNPGKYELSVCGSREYEQFLLKAVPYRFIAQNLPDLVRTINESLRISRGGLYCVLVLPPGGVTVEKSELPDLPGTKALVLQDQKRAIKSQPYQQWLEKSTETGMIITDKKSIVITVQQ